MKKILLIIVLTLVTLSQSVFAQQTDKKEYDILLKQNNNKFTINFKIKSEDSTQLHLRYFLKLYKVNKDYTSFEAIDYKIVKDIFYIKKNKNTERQIEYEAPTYLKGTYKLYLLVLNGDKIVAEKEWKPVILKKTSDFVEINLDTCRVNVNEETKKYTLGNGVDLKKEEKLYITCDITNYFNRDIEIIPQWKTYEDTFSSGKIVDGEEYSKNKIVLKSKKKQTITFIVPKAFKPNAYDAQLVLKENEKKVSNSINVHYVLAGESAMVVRASFN